MSSREEVWSGDRSTSHLLGLNCHASSFPPSPFLFMYSLLLPFSSCSSQAFKAWSPWFGFQIVRGISAFFHWLSVLLMAAQFSSSLHCYGKRQFVFGCSFSFFFFVAHFSALLHRPPARCDLAFGRTGLEREETQKRIL